MATARKSGPKKSEKIFDIDRESVKKRLAKHYPAIKKQITNLLAEYQLDDVKIKAMHFSAADVDCDPHGCPEGYCGFWVCDDNSHGHWTCIPKNI